MATASTAAPSSASSPAPPRRRSPPARPTIRTSPSPPGAARTAPPTCAAGPSAMPSSRPTRTTASRGWSTCARPDAITLYVDRERLLPETDPWFRQIVVSQGTFIEALVHRAAPARARRRSVDALSRRRVRAARGRRSAGGAHHLDRPAQHRRARSAVRAAPEPAHRQGRLRHHPAGRGRRCSTRCAARSSTRQVALRRHGRAGAAATRCARSAGNRRRSS